MFSTLTRPELPIIWGCLSTADYVSSWRGTVYGDMFTVATTPDTTRDDTHTNTDRLVRGRHFYTSVSAVSSSNRQSPINTVQLDRSSSTFTYKVLECVMFYFAPLIILTVLYSHMCRILWGSRVGETAVSDQILKLRRAVIKMLIISLLLYFICYSPMQGEPHFAIYTFLLLNLTINF
ncbi:unnamed protein product [Enterobius vermicularis]|uniref:G_PROTEIN_RECEP_F1_2 domain-containing protein n=1 Tax=Enterobius vermicularis TaxID=51028 RepID=A0A0N4UV16_ENTVE|nr:unnamed protein product [Enterobius vermicularis]